MSSNTCRWRRQRRIVHEGFNKSAASHFHTAEAEEATRLAIALLEDPNNFHEHVRNYVSSVMLSVTYDRPLHGGPDDKALRAGIDEFIKQNIAFTRVEQFAQIMPWLAHVPDWSAKWKREVRQVYEDTTRFFMDMVEDVETRMVSSFQAYCVSALLSASSVHVRTKGPLVHALWLRCWRSLSASECRG